MAWQKVPAIDLADNYAPPPPQPPGSSAACVWHDVVNCELRCAHTALTRDDHRAQVPSGIPPSFHHPSVHGKTAERSQKKWEARITHELRECSDAPCRRVRRGACYPATGKAGTATIGRRMAPPVRLLSTLAVVTVGSIEWMTTDAAGSGRRLAIG